jgi:peptide/nickel transport system permease protein
MRRYSFLGHRILQMIPVLVGITVITFFLLRLIPGDPARQILGQHYTPQAGAELRRRSASTGRSGTSTASS